MNQRVHPRLAALALAGAAALSAAAPAQAADREATVTRDAAEATWTSGSKSGFIYGSTVTSTVPLTQCTEGVWSCDTTLVKVDAPGKLNFSITSDAAANPTLMDIDLHVFESDATGKKGALIGEGTSATTSEAVTKTKAKAGFYLVLVDWYLGAGNYAGKVKLTPDPLPPA